MVWYRRNKKERRRRKRAPLSDLLSCKKYYYRRTGSTVQYNYYSEYVKANVRRVLVLHHGNHSSRSMLLRRESVPTVPAVGVPHIPYRPFTYERPCKYGSTVPQATSIQTSFSLSCQHQQPMRQSNPQ